VSDNRLSIEVIIRQFNSTRSNDETRTALEPESQGFGTVLAKPVGSTNRFATPTGAPRTPPIRSYTLSPPG